MQDALKFQYNFKHTPEFSEEYAEKMQIASIRTTCHICNADRPPMTDQESHFLAADELNHKA